MSYQDNILLKVHHIESNNGMINSSYQVEVDSSEKVISTIGLNESNVNTDKFLLNWNNPLEKVVSTTGLAETNVNIDNFFLNLDNYSNDKLNFEYHSFVESKSPTIKLIKVGVLDELNPMNYITHINTSVNNNDIPKYVFNETKKQQVKRLNLPDTNTISCQNCDTSFPTKYQYQRHQCEFNADKVVLKPEIAGKDVDKATRLRFECDVCKKSFVSNNNLERHKNCHKNRNSNVCEYCSKTFVSENRLKIHKENHCKKAGDTTKFYRSDVAVWRCEQCKQVFATHESGNKHVKQCITLEPSTSSSAIKSDVKPVNENNILNIKSIFEDNNFDTNFENAITNQPGFYKETTIALEKIITEMLYQCEFCNRTYAEKMSVLSHQRTHTTEKNYECIFCDQHFNSYCQATVHWQSKCNNESNLFYLPKMIYCEHCDRGFKSHEILYNHKNKKKHFSPKIHNKVQEKNEEVKSENEKAIAKLIENVISKLDQKVQLSNNENEADQKENDENSLLVPIGIVKLENDENNPENGKKKRGRKRKWQKTEVKNKIIIEEGCQYQCERCAAVFETIATLDVHKDTTHASTYKCEQCGQIVHSAKALMIHCRAHQSLKPYVCDQCGRSYSQTSHLWQHMRFHQGIKPFACPHEGCEARYTIRPDLKDHIRKVHTRERPFKCSVCQKCFLTGSVYYQHRLIHTNDRRYGCEFCSKRFFRADALNNHRRIHTDERPYPCPVCGREFRQKGDRNKHVRTQHSM